MQQFQQIQVPECFVCACGFSCLYMKEKDMEFHIDSCPVYSAYSEFMKYIERKDIQNANEDQLRTMKAEAKVYISRLDMMLMIYSQQQQPILQKAPSQTVQCEKCKKQFEANSDFDKVWYLENCSHIICKDCMLKICKDDFLPKKSNVTCVCGEKFKDQEIKQILGNELYEQLTEKLNLSLQNIIECCNCKERFCFQKGNIEEKIQDQNGKLVQGEQLKHYIENRFKCSKCHTEQCKNCMSVPYHTNMTCEEYKINKAAVKCRLCEQPTEIQKNQPEALQTICQQQDCQNRSKKLCTIKLKCGHFCQGLNNTPCLPCLNEKCAKDQNEDDYCNICFTEALKSQPCVQTTCGHIFHEDCLRQKLDAKWNGPRIVFNFMKCPLCNKFLDIQVPHFKNSIEQGQILLKEVQELCLQRLKLEEKEKDKELLDPTHQFFQKPLDYAMHIYCYYLCFKCKKPYFGGLKNCQQAADQDPKVEFKQEDLVCTKCCPLLTLEDKCNKHGVDYIDFKCRHCCSIALWWCHGTTHYCDPCHRNIKTNMTKPCPGPAKCPLGIPHKPNGEEMSLGCSLCRAERLKAK
ncbi:unnamed protein product [Paramecium pentaurelia]|uniref:RING-type domain-containing protein n=1 Tax=Paramecium pentaurelia TaxID=43138 RepID=A0A8S1W5I6_9CILI|nr:unnamed protein product [Paramecium pentaurelia]